MKPIKNLNKFQYTCLLYNYFVNQEQPEIVINFIYRHVYELIKEIKYLPHSNQFEDFFDTYRSTYYHYYKDVIRPSNDNWLRFLFPDSSNIYHFSFKKFYIGLWGRVHFGFTATKYITCDPLNWTISYSFKLNKKNKLVIRTCQYILLDHYSTFQVKEEFGWEQIANCAFIIFKSANKYAGQAYNEKIYIDDRLNYYEQYYRTPEVINKLMLISKSEFNQNYDPRIGEVCKKICESRKKDLYKDEIGNQPLHTYKEELEKGLYPIWVKKRKERWIASIIYKYKLKVLEKEKTKSI